MSQTALCRPLLCVDSCVGLPAPMLEEPDDTLQSSVCQLMCYVFVHLLYVCTGHETTATTAAAALYCISAHPVVEQQLLAELQSVLGDQPPTYVDLEHLPYLQASVPAGLGCVVLCCQ